MSDDLVKRLRAGCVTGNYEGLKFIESAKSNATMNEAADRIEQLEAALRELAETFRATVPFREEDMRHKYDRPFRREHAEEAYNEVVRRIKIARKALEGKDD